MKIKDSMHEKGVITDRMLIIISNAGNVIAQWVSAKRKIVNILRTEHPSTYRMRSLTHSF